MRSPPFDADQFQHAACSCLAACTVLVAADQADAESIRYVDRNGHVHQVVVRQEQPRQPPTPEPSTPTPMTAADPIAISIPYLEHVREAAKLYSIPIELIAAVMRIESGGNPKAVSSVGAMGLMQLMPVTAEEMQVTEPFDPRQNVLGGARYLRILINAHDGSLALALAAYHAGASTVEKYGGVPPYPETHKYVVQVIELYHRYKEKNAEARQLTGANAKQERPKN